MQEVTVVTLLHPLISDVSPAAVEVTSLHPLISDMSPAAVMAFGRGARHIPYYTPRKALYGVYITRDWRFTRTVLVLHMSEQSIDVGPTCNAIGAADY